MIIADQQKAADNFNRHFPPEKLAYANELLRLKHAHSQSSGLLMYLLIETMKEGNDMDLVKSKFDAMLLKLADERCPRGLESIRVVVAFIDSLSKGHSSKRDFVDAIVHEYGLERLSDTLNQMSVQTQLALVQILTSLMFAGDAALDEAKLVVDQMKIYIGAQPQFAADIVNKAIEHLNLILFNLINAKHLNTKRTSATISASLSDWKIGRF